MRFNRSAVTLAYNDAAPPPATRASASLRSIAVFEAAKGLIVLLAGGGIATLAHRHIQHISEHLVAHLHLNPAKGYPRIFLDLADRLTDSYLWTMAVAAAVYALVRFIEAYGLWNGKRWAKWFAALSGAIYVPFELRETLATNSGLAAGALLLNVLVVAVMLHDLRRSTQI
jgi:uncharacterized membrane protein (DUF2068 family)